MGTTNNFGLSTVGVGESIADDGYKYTKRDRETLDALLYTLFNHTHEPVQQVQNLLQGPQFRPSLTLATTGGQLPPGTDFFYRVSFMDGFGNETEASIQAQASTPGAIAPPPVLSGTSQATGGLLGPGTYRYALAYYQGDPTGEFFSTRAPNIFTVPVPIGTNTNRIIITLDTPPSGVDGWLIFRRDPATDEYYYLGHQPAPATTYTDDGSLTLDCNRKRPNVNTTNSTNSITVEIDPNDLPLDDRITAWRIYRTTIGGVYSSNSLVAEVVDTTTEGGSTLVTEFVDEGFPAAPGIPLEQSAVPPVIPGLDAARIFTADSGRLPSALAPWKVHQLHTYIPGELGDFSATPSDPVVYNQVLLAEDVVPNRVEVFCISAPVGADESNHGTVRVKDTASVNEVQRLYTNSEPANEIQTIVVNATAGTYTLTFDGQTTDPIAWDANGLLIKNALEDLSNITEVFVSGSGLASDPYAVEFLDPGNQSLPQMSATTTLLTGTVTIGTSIEGSDGGTFTLTFGVDTTSAIDFDADAATLETAIETLTGITDVEVTGTGTEEDPWLIEFVNPGATNVALLEIDDSSLNGFGFIFEEIRGHGPTTIDVHLNDTGQYYFWQTSTTPYGEMEAESSDASVTTDGVTVEDQFATNDNAVELNLDQEFVAWNPGVLDAGDYVARFWVSDPNFDAEFLLEVNDLNGPTTLESASLTPARAVYTPPYVLEFTADGVADIELRVTAVGAVVVRVDKFEFEADLPTFLAGTTLTVEGLVEGAPSNAGENLQVNVWY